MASGLIEGRYLVHQTYHLIPNRRRESFRQEPQPSGCNECDNALHLASTRHQVKNMQIVTQGLEQDDVIVQVADWSAQDATVAEV